MKTKERTYGGRKITIQGKVIKKRIRWTSPLPTSPRTLRLLLEICCVKNKFFQCVYLFKENNLELVNSINEGTFIRILGIKIKKSVFIDSAESIEILSP